MKMCITVMVVAPMDTLESILNVRPCSVHDLACNIGARRLSLRAGRVHIGKHRSDWNFARYASLAT